MAYQDVPRDINRQALRSVEKELDQDQFAADRNQALRMSNAKLSALRAQNPFLPIVPLPNSSVVGVLVGATPQDLNLPQGTKFISVKTCIAGGSNIGNAPAVFMSRNGVAAAPVGPLDAGIGMVAIDQTNFIYVEEIQHLSIMSPSTCWVVVNCYQQI